MPSTLFEKELVDRCCKGDRSAFREFYELYAGELMAIAMRYMKNREEAEDVLQDAFIKIFKNLAGFDERSALKTWMTRILINTALNALRKRHRMINWEAPEVIDKEFVPIPTNEYQVNELIGFIQQLPPGCRMVFNLYAIEGYPHGEIAKMLEISEGTSKSQLYRAKELLQSIIVSEESRTKRKAI